MKLDLQTFRDDLARALTDATAGDDAPATPTTVAVDVVRLPRRGWIHQVVRDANGLIDYIASRPIEED